MNQALLYSVDTLSLTDDELTTLFFIGSNDNSLLEHCDLQTLGELLDKHLIQCDNHNPLIFSLTELGRYFLPPMAQDQNS